MRGDLVTLQRLLDEVGRRPGWPEQGLEQCNRDALDAVAIRKGMQIERRRITMAKKRQART